MDISNQKVHFFGDSITYGWGMDEIGNSYVLRFREKYPNAEISNYGVSGSSIAPHLNPKGLSRDRHFLMRVGEMTEGADLIVVFGGTNDFGQTDASPIGQWGDKSIDTFYGALYVLYKDLIEKYPFANILVVTPLPRRDGAVKNVYGYLLQDYVQAIIRTANYFSLPILDLYRNSGMNPEMDIINELMFFDGLHPNEAGHKRIFERMDAYIKHLL
ncbi:MAG: SGNH/GDSL hydrolase family protein [Clostridia bacterium]|nr:SGNH/GDSL hydrolase family protein [Clostridia bacterium]